MIIEEFLSFLLMEFNNMALTKKSPMRSVLKKNYFYIKSFNFIDEVILYPDTFFKKIKLFFYLFKKKYNLVGVLDGKKNQFILHFF